MRRRAGKGLLSTLGNGFTLLFCLFGFVVLVWACITHLWETYSFWRYGVAKSAHVVALDHTSRSKSSVTYYYAIEIEGRGSTHGFPCRLSLDNDVAVLTLPNDPAQVILGDEHSNAFEIFASPLGSKVMAVLVIALYVLVLVAPPMMLVAWIRYRKPRIYRL